MDRHVDELVATSIAEMAGHAGSLQLNLLLEQGPVLDDTMTKLEADGAEARRLGDYCDKRGLHELGGYAMRVESLISDVTRLIHEAAIVRMVSDAMAKHSAALSMHDVYVAMHVELYARMYREGGCLPSSDMHEAVYLAETLAELSGIARIVRIEKSRVFGSTMLQQSEQPSAEDDDDDDDDGTNM